MTELELVAALEAHCPQLQPPPRVGFDGQYQGVHDPDRNQRASVTNQEALILAELAAGKRVLEIGTGLGVSTVAMAQTAKFVVSVDTAPWVRQSVGLGGKGMVVASIDEVTGPFDMAFIDGLHDFESVSKDIEDAILLVKPGGVIVFHDMGQSGVAEAVKAVEWASVKEHPTLGLLTECEVPA